MSDLKGKRVATPNQGSGNHVHFAAMAAYVGLDPQRAAHGVIDRGFVTDYGHALQMFKHDVAYDRWREYDPEDTVRFNALRLQEVGMIKSGPNDIIARGTNWRFLNELKQELKA